MGLSVAAVAFLIALALSMLIDKWAFGQSHKESERASALRFFVDIFALIIFFILFYFIIAGALLWQWGIHVWPL